MPPACTQSQQKDLPFHTPRGRCIFTTPPSSMNRVGRNIQPCGSLSNFHRPLSQPPSLPSTTSANQTLRPKLGRSCQIRSSVGFNAAWLQSLANLLDLGKHNHNPSDFFPFHILHQAQARYNADMHWSKFLHHLPQTQGPL